MMSAMSSGTRCTSLIGIYTSKVKIHMSLSNTPNDLKILESYDDIRTWKMSSGATLIGRVIDVDSDTLTADAVFQIVPLSKTVSDYGLVPWIPGVDVMEEFAINVINIDVLTMPTDDFIDGWGQAVETYAEVLLEELEDADKEANGQLTEDEIDELLKEYDSAPVADNTTKH